MIHPILALTLVALLQSATLGAQTTDPPPASPTLNAPIVTHDTFTVISKAIGEPRPINVHVPKGYATSKAKFPVLYMPDGALDEDFPHVVVTVDSLIALGVVRPFIVVGIPNTVRRRDLTGPTRVKSDSAIAPAVGGSAKFRTFVRDELFPVISKKYRVTGERAIVGESLAGLFILETFFVDPSMFDHYVALDASLWWNDGLLVDSAAEHLKQFNSKPRTLYFASSDVKEMIVANAKLNSTFQAMKPRGLTWQYVPRGDLTHATIFAKLGGAAIASELK
ncbi:MAG: alpha/beta hydrolase-fold protein [Gemmatimonadaceae bacterium]